MAARATGSATISFGLVSIPVKLFSTVDTTKAIHFNYLAKDGSRLKQQYISSATGKVVPNDERVMGYEFAKGQYVLFTPAEVKAMNVEATNAIEIKEFVPVTQVERTYIDKVYYLGPDKGAARAYHLLKETMKDSGRAAIANYAARGKSYLVLLRPMEDGLVMEQLKHADELRPFDEVPLDLVQIKDSERELAKQIVDQISNDQFEPRKYFDEVLARTQAMIDQKVAGQEITVSPEEKPEAKIIDLMEALRASVAQGKRTPAVRASVRTNQPSDDAAAKDAAAKDAAAKDAAPKAAKAPARAGAKSATKRVAKSGAKNPRSKAKSSGE